MLGYTFDSKPVELHKIPIEKKISAGNHCSTVDMISKISCIQNSVT